MIRITKTEFFRFLLKQSLFLRN